MVKASWKSDIECKSSTKYLNANVLIFGSSHHIWSTVRDNIHDSNRAQIKCKQVADKGRAIRYNISSALPLHDEGMMTGAFLSCTLGPNLLLE